MLRIIADVLNIYFQIQLKDRSVKILCFVNLHKVEPTNQKLTEILRQPYKEISLHLRRKANANFRDILEFMKLYQQFNY